MISALISTIESPDDQLFMLQLYKEHEQLMYWAASKYLTNIEDRRDAVQDAIVTLINNLVTIRKLSENHLRTYVVCTVESKSINLVKRKNIELRLFDDLDSAPVGTPVDFIDEKLFQISMRNTISLIWPKLSMQDKLVLEGKYILGYNDNELGKMLGCKASSVRMYLTRARRKAVELILEVGEFEPSRKNGREL